MNSRAEIAAVPTVPFTKTWSPIHHKDIIQVVDTQLRNLGLEPISENFELSKDGKDLFATISLKEDTSTSGSVQTQLGFRNSMKKRFSLGFVAGTQVMVCSNLDFSGEFEEHRRHTAGLDMDALAKFTSGAIETVMDKNGQYRAWFDKLTHLALFEKDKKVWTYDAFANGVINPSDFTKFLKAYDEEVAEQKGYYLEETLAHFHGAITRLLRGNSMSQIMYRTQKLNGMLQGYVPMDAPGKKIKQAQVVETPQVDEFLI